MSHYLNRRIAIFAGVLMVFVMLLILPMSVSASEARDTHIDIPSSDTVDTSSVALTEDETAQINVDVEEAVVAEVLPQETSKDSRAAIINAVSELKPTSPQSTDLDIFLDDIMSDLITDDMTTYQKVKASYDYLVTTTRYGSHMRNAGTQIGSVTAQQIINRFGTLEGYGAVVLGSKTGMCNAYASAFILMAREIGLDARLVKGSTKGAGGGYVAHQWAEIDIDGVTYLFDPQLEQNLTAAGLGTYNVFCKTYAQVPGRYIKY